MHRKRFRASGRYLIVVALTMCRFASGQSGESAPELEQDAPPPPIAAPVSDGQVVKLNVKQKQFVGKLNDPLAEFAVGDEATFPAGVEQCRARMVGRKGAQILFEAPNCAGFAALKRGAGFRRTGTKAARSASSSGKEGLLFVVGLGYHITNKLSFDAGQASILGTSTSLQAAFGTTNAFELTAGAMYANRRSFGGFGFLTYQSSRDVTNVTLTLSSGASSSSSYGSSKPKFQVVLLEFGGLYRWSEFYLPFGLNYSLPIYEEPASSSKTEINGFFGAQIGAGYLIRSGFAFEAWLKAIGATAKTTASSVTIDYKTGFMPGFGLQAKYAF